MLDDLRQQAAESFGEEETPPPPRPRSNRILGMSPLQTFIVALMLLALTCLLSSACLLATGRIVPSFMY